KFFVAKGVVQVECPVRQLVRNGCRVRVAVDKAAPGLTRRQPIQNLNFFLKFSLQQSHPLNQIAKAEGVKPV
ncbi:MAG: hypothetical protein LBB79_00910, partial [Prevotellaceae bacterium]|nr:hypothetical protein [Prevotellaceae bacterium]